MTERAVLLTGIGGQGVQLAARTLAFAAIAEGLDAMMFGEYSGSMRGGNTDGSVIIGTERLLMPPTVSRAWVAIAMHHEFWPATEPRVESGGIVLVDRNVFRGEIGRSDVTVVEVDCDDTAAEVGNPKAGAMVALGALAAATGMVGVSSLQTAATEILPPYRAQHAAANAAAIAAGYELVPTRVAEAWPERTAEVAR